MNIDGLTITDAHHLLLSGAISSTELTRAILDRIQDLDDMIGAYITVTPETALAQARQADERIARKDMSPLTGIPLAVKDLICTKDIRTTCASRMLERFIPPYDATVVEKLNAAGAVMVGKANMDEFAMGSSTEFSAFKPTKNPWDTRRIPGGSSGGSAAAVAAGLCLGALGSDTGGSIRQPAAHCGIVGLKPTYGRVSRYGLVAFASSLDQIGPLTKTVLDAALLMNTISGHDSKDATSVPRRVPDFTALLDTELDGCTVGIPKQYFNVRGLNAAVEDAVKRAVETIEGLGAHCVEVSLPHTEYAVAAYYLIAPSEASSNLARYDGVKYGLREEGSSIIEMYRKTRSSGFGPEVQRRIILGTYALSAGYYDAYYKKASQVRTLIMDDFKKAFDSCDAILSPTVPAPPFEIGENLDDPLTMYLSDIYTLSANLAGIPGISVPCGFSPEGLPIGLQLLGAHFNEPMLLRIAHQFEQATEFHRKTPELPDTHE
ncbi:MAG: Asp-tRNA(Asn)/Glu-tRNA(Gln) amidotransferase subunit GatA [Desulfobacterales bacterium]